MKKCLFRHFIQGGKVSTSFPETPCIYKNILVVLLNFFFYYYFFLDLLKEVESSLRTNRDIKLNQIKTI